MLATFISSTPVLQDSWRLCSLANTSASVVTDQVRGIAYVAFSGTIMPPLADPSCANLEALDRPPDGLFPPLQQRHAQHQHEDPPMLHAAILHHFLSLYTSPAFLNQVCFCLPYLTLPSHVSVWLLRDFFFPVISVHTCIESHLLLFD